MKNRKWNNVLAFTLFLIGTSLAQADPIKIGAFLAVTGPASFLGDPEPVSYTHLTLPTNREV